MPSSSRDRPSFYRIRGTPETCSISTNLRQDLLAVRKFPLPLEDRVAWLKLADTRTDVTKCVLDGILKDILKSIGTSAHANLR